MKIKRNYYKTYNIEKTFLARLNHDADLLTAIKDIFKSNNIKTGFFNAIGAVKCARIGFYNQQDKVYKELKIDEPAEILSCIGNISEIDDDMSVHAHIVLGLKDGNTKGGHLLEGTLIFACELFGMSLKGTQLKRKYDDTTGLKLWDFQKNQH